MVIGALGISLGLALYGPKLIKTVGSEITELDQIRAFSIALAAAITVILASQLGLPVSSTHIALGGVFGVGFLREWLDRTQRLEYRIEEEKMRIDEIKRSLEAAKSELASIESKEEKSKVRNLFKTSTGGLAILRYDVTLCRLAEATAFALEEMVGPLREHLSTVDRVQARLGLMRTCRMISLSSAMVIIFALLLWNIAEITTADRNLTLILGFPLMLLMRVLEWRLEPDWR